MKSPAYRPDIDGLRALAILAVVAFHAFPEQFPGGFTGVDIFFVISGYLITSIIAGNLARGTFSFAEFYARRVRRIFPALVLVLACVWLAGRLLLTPEDSRQLSLHTMAGASFTSNFLLWQEAGYFDAAAEGKPLLHLWSLAIEEQFYLVWPLLLVLAWKWRGRAMLAVAMVGGASFLANLFGVFHDPDGAFYLPAGRFWELMIGCGQAIAEQRAGPRPANRARDDAEAGVGLAMILAAVWLLDRQSAFPGLWALLPTVGAWLLLRSGPGSWLNRRVFARAPMVRLGLMSYALYLWHWPLLAFLNLLHPEGVPPAARLAAVLLALALASLTYSLLELNVRRHPQRAWVPLLVGLGSLVAVTAFAGYRAGLGPDENIEARLQVARAWPASFQSDPRCRERVAYAGYCAIARAAAPTHALLGDSHANHFYPGLAAEIARTGGNLIHLGVAGCAPLQGVDTNQSDQCSAMTGKALSYVLAERDIHTVILAANWHVYAEGRRFSAYQKRTAGKLELRAEGRRAGAGNAGLFTEGIARTVELLERGGKKVVFLRQVPELAIRYETCLEKLRAAKPEEWNDRDCAVARRQVDRYVGEYTGLADAALAGRPGVLVLDPMEALCDLHFCNAVFHSELLYRDDVHLSVAGSRLIAGRLWPQVAASN